MNEGVHGWQPRKRWRVRVLQSGGNFRRISCLTTRFSLYTLLPSHSDGVHDECLMGLHL